MRRLVVPRYPLRKEMGSWLLCAACGGMASEEWDQVYIMGGAFPASLTLCTEHHIAYISAVSTTRQHETCLSGCPGA